MVRTSGLGFCFILVGLWLSNTSLSGQTGSLALSPGTVVAGGTAHLILSFAGSGQTAGLQWAVTYPASAVTAITVTAGPALAAAGKTMYCNGVAGVYMCLATGSNTAVIGNGAVATVNITLAA